MEQKYNDTFLARWLSNDLSAEELQEFENSEDYAKYVQITETLETAEVAEFDLEKNLQATRVKISEDSKDQKRKRLIPLWSYPAAASILILVFAYNFFFAETTFSTQIAEQTNFELPDGSKVDLNAESSLSFTSYNWKENRSLQLKGEAYFKVEKGSTFTVHTDKGEVTVLGTQFIVNARENFYHVVCYEGKVQVITAEKDSIVLTKGKGFFIDPKEKKEYQIEATAPSWINQESSFKNMPILQVIDELERQFKITIEGKEYIKPALFTGVFSHQDDKLAIQTVFTAMGIPYTINASGNVLVQKY